jgi:hypothetical protein
MYFDYSIDNINWDAVFKCLNEYRDQYPGRIKKNGYDYEHDHDHYNDYMKTNWGIDHSTEYIRVIDEQKYIMFLLRFS